jgi:hypothetical protein
MQPDQCFPLAGSRWILATGIYQNQLFICFTNGDCAQYPTITGNQALMWMNLIIAGAVPIWPRNRPGPGHGTIVNLDIGRYGQMNNFPYIKIPCPCAAIEGALPGKSCATAGTVPYGFSYTWLANTNDVINLTTPTGLRQIRVTNQTTAAITLQLSAGINCPGQILFSTPIITANSSALVNHAFTAGQFCSLTCFAIISPGPVTLSVS